MNTQGAAVNEFFSYKPTTSADWAIYCDLAKKEQNILDSAKDMRDKKLINQFNKVFYFGTPYADQCAHNTSDGKDRSIIVPKSRSYASKKSIRTNYW